MGIVTDFAAIAFHLASPSETERLIAFAGLGFFQMRDEVFVPSC
jgi:hypothetical protein